VSSRSRITIALASLVITGLAASASAQNGPPPGAPPQGGARATQRNGAPPPPQQVNIQKLESQIQDQWDTLVLKRSKPFLELSDQQYPNFFLKMTALQDLRNRHVRDRRKLLNEMRAMTNPQRQEQAPPTDAELDAKNHQIDDLETQFGQQERMALKAVDEQLTPYQRVRFRVFEEQMEVQKLQMLIQVTRSVPAAGPASPAGANGQPAAAVKPGRGGGK
jgi:hypothetical protein